MPANGGTTFASLLASVFVAVVFSTALLGAIRASDSRRAGRGVAATAYAALAVVGVLLASGVIVYSGVAGGSGTGGPGVPAVRVCVSWKGG